MIYISCPRNQYTGGPTLAHQLCYILNQNHISASMFYYGKKDDNVSPVHKNYEVFKNPFVVNLEKNITDIIIVPETKTRILSDFPNAQKYIWWMSVDNFYLSKISLIKRFARKLGFYTFSVKKEEKNFSKLTNRILSDSSIKHLVQSEYAKIFLKTHNVSNDNIFYLTDYIEEEVASLANDMPHNERKNVVLYNPKKGLEFTKKIISAMNDTNIEFVPLVNMSKAEVVSKLCSSKLYIDFGNHPGKDRFPREAVTCGCCIITGRKGSANNDIDIPIPEKYKFDDNEANIHIIIQAIHSIMDNYDKAWTDYTEYKNKTLKEKEIFIKQAIELFSGEK